MPRYKITVEYDGTGLAGWQAQEGRSSVQGILRNALTAFSGETADVVGAGRTDAGVHATAQVAHFELAATHTPRTVMLAMNDHLRGFPVVVTRAENAAPDFHARFSATGRRYLYRVLNRSARPALNAERVWYVRQKLDIAAMEAAARDLTGHHDFTSFRDTNCNAKSPIKTLDTFSIEQVAEEIHIRAAARSFLHHQVRIMVGTVIQIGHGRFAADAISGMLEARERAAAGQTAPAHGLYLTEVIY